MKKSIIAISLVASFCFADSGLNDLELLGQNVIKNNTELKQLRLELDELKAKINSADSGKLKVGDAITNNSVSPKIVKEAMLFKAKKVTYIRNSPSIFSSIIAKVEKGQVLKKVKFESKYKIDSWIFVGNGFIMKSEFSEVENEN